MRGYNNKYNNNFRNIKFFLGRFDKDSVTVFILSITLVFLLTLSQLRNSNKVTLDHNNTSGNTENVSEAAEYLKDDIAILSDTLMSAKDAEKWAESRGASKEFVSLAQLYWKYADERGNVNPALAYAQAAKETGFGNFGGVLDASYKNPCGLKETKGGGDYDASAHKKFATWDEGVKAQLDHLALYAGAESYPKKDTTDPRHFETLLGKAKKLSDLSAKWAPSETYGQEIYGLYEQMLDSCGKTEVFAAPQ